MGYYSEVAAIIGGHPKKIQQFVKNIAEKNMEDTFKILPDFQIVKLESDLSIFIFYHDYIKWYAEAETTWQSLCELVNQFQLSFAFYRLGGNIEDIETADNSEADYFDSRLLTLFSYHCCIEVNHEHLCNVLKDT